MGVEQNWSNPRPLLPALGKGNAWSGQVVIFSLLWAGEMDLEQQFCMSLTRCHLKKQAAYEVQRLGAEEGDRALAAERGPRRSVRSGTAERVGRGVDWGPRRGKTGDQGPQAAPERSQRAGGEAEGPPGRVGLARTRRVRKCRSGQPLEPEEKPGSFQTLRLPPRYLPQLLAIVFSPLKLRERRPPSSRPHIPGASPPWMPGVGEKGSQDRGSRQAGVERGFYEGEVGVVYFYRARGLGGGRPVTWAGGYPLRPSY